MRATALGVAALLLGACRTSPAASPAGGAVKLATTDGSIAVANMDAEIESLETARRDERLTAGRPHALVDLYLARGQFLGRIADYERAEALAEDLVRQAPADPASYLSRAATRSTFHRFPDALADLDRAEELGLRGDRLDSPRAAILQATGRYEEALALRRQLSKARPDLLTLGAEATALGERGETEAAERLFRRAPSGYRDVSPFPVAWLEFQQGLMWMRAGDMARARELFEAARERLPQYAAATGHLGEIEAALGHRDRAIALLGGIAASTDDPDAAGQLARVLAEAGRAAEAAWWREKVAARYEELLARHPQAFADHAAEFWLGAGGGDPHKALALARKNLDLRRTPASYSLVARAELAAGDALGACQAAESALSLGAAMPPLRDLRDQACRLQVTGS